MNKEEKLNYIRLIKLPCFHGLSVTVTYIWITAHGVQKKDIRKSLNEEPLILNAVRNLVRNAYREHGAKTGVHRHSSTLVNTKKIIFLKTFRLFSKNSKNLNSSNIHTEHNMDSKRRRNTVFGQLKPRQADASNRSQTPNHWQCFLWW